MENKYKKDLEKTEKIKKKNRRRKPERQRKLLRVLKIMMIVLLLSFIAAIMSLLILRGIGKKQLQEHAVGSAEDMRMNVYHTSDLDQLVGVPEKNNEMEETGSPEDKEEKEGRVYYNGKAYDFNRDILTFLVMGIDQRSETVQEYTEGFEGGSADAIFLLVLDPHSKKMQIIAIDRNTMTDVDIYDYYGSYEKTVRTQLCVQHGFGDGTVKSAGYMEKAVSNLLYGLPINGYCAVNMSAIPQINDAVGGVDVTVLDDITKMDKALVKGADVHLMGKSAFWYVKYRDTGVFGSAAGRLERQRQYLTAYVSKAKSEFRKNPALPVTLFGTLKDYMTTDLNAEKVTYLATMAAGFDFSGVDIRKIPGETVMGDEYEEFYVDEDGMYELILDVFYEEVP